MFAVRNYVSDLFSFFKKFSEPKSEPATWKAWNIYVDKLVKSHYKQDQYLLVNKQIQIKIKAYLTCLVISIILRTAFIIDIFYIIIVLQTI